MSPADSYPWIVLRLRLGPNAVRVEYEDSRGVRRRSQAAPSAWLPGWDERSVSVVPAPPWLHLPWDYKIRIHQDFDDLVGALLQGLPQFQSGPHANGPVPLAVFYETPPGASDTSGYWGSVVESLVLPLAQPERFQLVRLPRRKQSRPRPPFSLPLRVLATSASCDAALEALRNSWWYGQNPEVKEHGIAMVAGEASGLDGRREAEPFDVVIVDESTVEAVMARIARGLAPARRPRLVLFLGRESHGAYVSSLEPPSGIAFIWLPFPPYALHPEYPIIDPLVGEFTKRLFYGLVHDYPLHEALKSATRDEINALYAPPLLIADPASNNSIRLSQALAQLRQEAEGIRRWRRLGRLGQFVERAGEGLSEGLRSELLQLRNSRQTIERAVQLTMNPGILFDQETLGIVPMAEAATALRGAKAAHEMIEAAVAGIAADPALAGELGKLQERRVDVTLRRLGAPGQYVPIDKSLPLTTGQSYRMALHIGHPSPESLMQGEPPPVDPLLPEPEKDGYDLEVAFFKKDFELLSESVQPLYLPRFGGSEPIYFEIRAPQRAGAAEARIGVYYNNNLLQSFLLRAHVVAEGEAVPGPLRIKMFVAEGGEGAAGGRWVETEADGQVVVHLAFSQSARFNNVGDIGRRELSVGVNQDAGGFHTFMMKLDGQAQPVPLAEKLLDEQITYFRDTLRSNVQTPSQDPLFPTYPSPGAGAGADFLRVVRVLIERGAELHNALFTHISKEMRAKLRALAASSDKTVQVIRHDPNYVFPWPIVYDFPLPTKVEGAPEPPVCLGHDGDAPPAAGQYPAKSCKHGPDEEVYCIYGFWGLRHQVEQLVELSGAPQDAITEIAPSSSQSYVRVAAGVNDDYAKDLVQKMSAEMGAAFVETDSASDLVDLLWDDTTRPAILVVMGHMDVVPLEGEPREPRIVLVPKKRWFLASSIMKRLKKKDEWKPPNTLVLLMACSAGATELTTLNDFVTNLTTAGAAAVVGTECLVFSSLVARFAREVTSDLWNKKSLGEAVKFFNRRLVGAGNPLAFIFNCLGNSEIKLVKPPT